MSPYPGEPTVHGVITPKECSKRGQTAAAGEPACRGGEICQSLGEATTGWGIWVGARRLRGWQRWEASPRVDCEKALRGNWKWRHGIFMPVLQLLLRERGSALKEMRPKIPTFLAVSCADSAWCLKIKPILLLHTCCNSGGEGAWRRRMYLSPLLSSRLELSSLFFPFTAKMAWVLPNLPHHFMSAF